MSLLLPSDIRGDIIDGWLLSIANDASRTWRRTSGHVLAVGAAFETFQHDLERQRRIVRALASRCSLEAPVEARSAPVRGISLVLASSQRATHWDRIINDAVFSAIQFALNDYTINERGDVGSFVRAEALTAMEEVWKCGIFDGSDDKWQLEAAVVRSSVEKLDRIRSQAANCLARAQKLGFSE